MFLINSRKKQIIKRLEEELELNLVDNPNKYSIPFVVNGLVLCGAMVAREVELTAVLAVSLCGMAYLTNKARKKHNFKILEKTAIQDIASSGKMDKLSGEDVAYIANGYFEKYELNFDDIATFARKMNRNNLDFLKDKITKDEYLKIRAKQEKELYNKINVK